jgi:hypothetical protein
LRDGHGYECQFFGIRMTPGRESGVFFSKKRTN